MHKLMVKPVTGCISAICEIAGTSPLDKEEKAQGELAFAAMLYQYGGDLDARVLVALFLAGISTSRLAEFAANRKNKKPSVTVESVTAHRAELAKSGT